MTILAIAAGAIAAIQAYRRRRAEDPEGTNEKVGQIRQSVAVVLAIADALWSVLDALISLTRPRGNRAVNGSPSGPLRPIGQVASDASAEA